MPVPFADLQLQHQTIKSEIDGAIESVIRDNAFIRGPYVDGFERAFAAAPSAIDTAITPRTVGIVPVHLYGQPAWTRSWRSQTSTSSG